MFEQRDELQGVTKSASFLGPLLGTHCFLVKSCEEARNKLGQLSEQCTSRVATISLQWDIRTMHRRVRATMNGPLKINHSVVNRSRSVDQDTGKTGNLSAMLHHSPIASWLLVVWTCDYRFDRVIHG